jgi:hypothetical protein
VLLLALLATAAGAPSVARPAEPAVGQAVRVAALDLCTGLVRGQITEATLPAERFAMRRLPSVEAQLTSAAKGQRAVVFGGETAGNLLLLTWWPATHQCNVTFKGPQAPKTMADIRTALDAAGSRYVRAPNIGNPTAGFPNAFVYRSKPGAAALTVKLHMAAPDDASQSHVVEVQAARAR